MTRLSRNIIYNFLGQTLLLVIGFAAVKLIFHGLGAEAVGIIYFVLMMNTVLCAVLEMGVCSATVREISSHFESEPEYVRELIRTFSLFYWSAYVLIGVLIYFLAPIIVERWLNLETMNASTAITVFRAIGIASLMILPQRFYASLFNGLQRMFFNNFIDVTVMGIQQLGIIVIISLGGGLVHIACWFAACFTLSILTYIFISAKLFSWQALVPGYSPGVIKRNLKYSLNVLSISILSIIHMQADKLIISKLLPISVVGYYGVGYSSVSKGMVLPNAVSQAAFPLFSALFKTGDHPGLMFQYRKLQDMVCFAAVPLFAVIPFAIVPFFTYIFNAEIASMLNLPITFLCVGFCMRSALVIPYVISLASGKPQIAVKTNSVALFTILPVAGILIYFFGLNGAGFSWVLYNMFVCVYAMPRICKECMNTSSWRWFKHVGRIFFLFFLTYGLVWGTLQAIGNYSVLSLSIAYIFATISFLLGALYIMGEELREWLLQCLQEFKNHIRIVKTA